MSLVYNIESVKLLSHVRLFVTPWAVAYQAAVHGILWARILEWVASCSLLQGIFQVSSIAGGFFTSWATREDRVK